MTTAESPVHERGMLLNHASASSEIVAAAGVIAAAVPPEHPVRLHLGRAESAARAASRDVAASREAIGVQHPDRPRRIAVIRVEHGRG